MADIWKISSYLRVKESSGGKSASVAGQTAGLLQRTREGSSCHGFPLPGGRDTLVLPPFLVFHSSFVFSFWGLSPILFRKPLLAVWHSLTWLLRQNRVPRFIIRFLHWKKPGRWLSWFWFSSLYGSFLCMTLKGLQFILNYIYINFPILYFCFACLFW